MRDWLAWNEPNNPVYLQPQYRRSARWVIASAQAYARICNAIYSGVHAARPGERAGRLRRDLAARQQRPDELAAVGLPARVPERGQGGAACVTFDAWAHHPYYSNPSQRPSGKDGAHGSVELGNIDTLIHLVTQLYGNKRIWITEYGYETNPPDPYFGVSWSKQALYLKQAFAIARANPRIDLMTWFLLRDDANVNGWQSGLIDRSRQEEAVVRGRSRASSD